MSTVRCLSCSILLTFDEAQRARCPSCGAALLSAATVATVPPAAPTFQEAPPVPAPEPAIALQSGVANKDRLLAAMVDNLVAVIVGIAFASLVRHQGDMTRGILGVVGYFLYYFLTEGLLGTTPGKFIFGLRVFTKTGQKAGWLQIGVRTLLRLVEVNPLVVGALPACIAIVATRHHQRLGDLLAGTVVVASTRAGQP